jgi:hypothetical protein
VEGRLIKSTELELWGLNQNGTLSVKFKSNTLQNLFPNMTGVQNRDLQQLTYVVAFVNQNSSLALTSARIYFRVAQAGGANLSIALDPLGPVVKTGNVWSPSNPPTTFTAPTTIGTGLAVATLNPGFAIAVWVRRIAAASGAVKPERNTLTINGTSLA